MARTAIVGGVTSGYSLIGSDRIAISPAARMTRERTTAKIGRSMKKREKRIGLERLAWCAERECHPERSRRASQVDSQGSRSARSNYGLHAIGLGDDLHSGAHAHQTIDHDALAGLQSRLDSAQSVDHAAEGHRSILERVVTLEHEHEFAILIRADRLILDQRRRPAFAADEPHAGEQAGSEQLRLVRHDGAYADRAGAAIDPIVDEVERPLVGKSRLVGEADVDGTPDRTTASRTIGMHVLEIRPLVAIEV